MTRVILIPSRLAVRSVEIVWETMDPGIFYWYFIAVLELYDCVWICRRCFSAGRINNDLVISKLQTTCAGIHLVHRITTTLPGVDGCSTNSWAFAMSSSEYRCAMSKPCQPASSARLMS